MSFDWRKVHVILTVECIVFTCDFCGAEQTLSPDPKGADASPDGDLQWRPSPNEYGEWAYGVFTDDPDPDGFVIGADNLETHPTILGLTCHKNLNNYQMCAECEENLPIGVTSPDDLRKK